MNKTWITECVFIMGSGCDYSQDQRMSTLIWPGHKSVTFRSRIYAEKEPGFENETLPLNLILYTSVVDYTALLWCGSSSHVDIKFPLSE